MWKMAGQAEGCVRQGVRMQRQGQEVHLPERLQALASGCRFGMEPIYIIYIVGCQLFHPAREGRPLIISSTLSIRRSTCSLVEECVMVCLRCR